MKSKQSLPPSRGIVFMVFNISWSKITIKMHIDGKNSDYLTIKINYASKNFFGRAAFSLDMQLRGSGQQPCFTGESSDQKQVYHRPRRAGLSWAGLSVCRA